MKDNESLMFTRSDGRGGRATEVGAGGALPRAVPDRELRSATVLWRSAGGDRTKVRAYILSLQYIWNISCKSPSILADFLLLIGMLPSIQNFRVKLPIFYLEVAVCTEQD